MTELSADTSYSPANTRPGHNYCEFDHFITCNYNLVLSLTIILHALHVQSDTLIVVNNFG